MFRKFILFLMATGLLSFQPLVSQTVQVTFRLDMNGMSVPSSGPSIAGNFQSALGGSNWQPGQHFLTDADLDGIYEITVNLPEGLYSYKFINGSSWSDPTEGLGPACGVSDGGGNFNRQISVGPNGADLKAHSFDDCEGLIRFQVDMSQQQVSPNGVHVSGDWVWWAGYGNGWDPAAVKLYDANGDGIYSVDILMQDTNHIRFRYYNGNTLADAEPIPGPCSSPTALIARGMQGSMAPTELSPVCFGLCTPCPIDTSYSTYWWNESVFYEIFVRSFYDSDGDGIGDFQGMIQKLDYLNDGDPTTDDDLGVDGIWLMPMMPSPSYHGYDVTDYEAVNPDYGSMQDFEEFLDSAHARGIKVIIDFVMNHTSTQHPWFQSSASNPTGPEADYYVWSPVDSGYQGPWGQQVWHPNGGRFYYGIFWGGMPDINYDNPTVKLKMLDAAEFWLNKGVDGFRLDAIKYLDEDFPVLENTPETFQLIEEYKTRTRSVNSQAFSVGEVWSNTAAVVPYVDTNKLDVCFEFSLAETLINSVNQGSASTFNGQFPSIVNAYPKLQLAPFLTNHDQDRVFSDLGMDEDKMKLAAGLLLTMPGVPFLYYGEEVGMIGTGAHENIRTPMQWSSASAAGFTTGQAWHGVNWNYAQYNVDVMSQNSSSILNRYKQLIKVRKSEPTLQKGYSLLLQVTEPQVISYARVLNDEALIVVANLGANNLKPTLDLSASTIRSDQYVAVDILSGDSVGSINVGSQGEIVAQQMTVDLQGRDLWIIRLVPSTIFSTDPFGEFLSSELIVYPNPGKDILKVEWIESAGPYLIEIYNISGQRVLTFQTDGVAAQINTADFKSGTYIIVSRNDQDVVVNRWIRE